MNGSPPTNAGQDTAVIGVVIAGLLSAFLTPGPFDLGSMLIGLLLLVVLVAYADLTPSTFRHALGTAAAGAFAALYLFGHWLDVWVQPDQAHYWLSGWPKNDQTLDDFQPDADGGQHLLFVWLGLTLVLLAVLVAVTKALRDRVAALARKRGALPPATLDDASEPDRPPRQEDSGPPGAPPSS